ncbi:MAG: triphosphoribosyl-dephospho-CoA synthase [Gemmatimonadota bacterium]
MVAQIACLLEASAPKPGNVTQAAGFPDARFEHYLASAAAIGPAMAEAGERGVGATIRAAHDAVRRWVSANTNLGIILLLAPLAKAAAGGRKPLRDSLRQLLRRLNVDDAVEAYHAIRAAAPGGLDTVAEQDIRGTPTISLREAMALAADRDSIASEYVSDFEITFERCAPALREARCTGLGWPDAVVQAYLRVLADIPDTLIARKFGRAEAEEVSRAARAAVERGGILTEEGRALVAALDRELRREGHARNPGTTADLIAAGLFVVLWEESGPL